MGDENDTLAYVTGMLRVAMCRRTVRFSSAGRFAVTERHRGNPNARKLIPAIEAELHCLPTPGTLRMQCQVLPTRSPTSPESPQ